MSSDDVAISVRNLSKRYFLYDRPEDRLKQSIMPRLQRMAGRKPAQYYTEFAALNDVSFEVKRGETVGIVGRNGSGKSTLLQIICGTLAPTSGTARTNGRVAALLELGAGFNPEFTGRENVYLCAAILGLSRAEIDIRFDAIADFAGIGQFMEQPVRLYSSGMYARLAFATAINVDADILVVDEALAVGDEAFQRKCFARIEDLREKGCTILFVSHAGQTVVQLCSRALLIDAGELLLEGRPKQVVGQYQRLVNLPLEEGRAVREELLRYNRAPWRSIEVGKLAKSSDLPGCSCGSEEGDDRSSGWLDPNLASKTTVSYESRDAKIRDVSIRKAGGELVNVLVRGARYRYEYRVEFMSSARDVSLGMLIKSVSGLELAGANNDRSASSRISFVEADSTMHVCFEFVCRLMPGTYFANAGLVATVEGQRRYLHRLLDAVAFRVVDGEETIDYGFFSMDCQLETSLESVRSDAIALNE